MISNAIAILSLLLIIYLFSGKLQKIERKGKVAQKLIATKRNNISLLHRCLIANNLDDETLAKNNRDFQSYTVARISSLEEQIFQLQKENAKLKDQSRSAAGE